MGNSITREVKFSAPNKKCDAQKVSGPCRAYFKRWHFDGKSCVQFVFGGCMGNSNNFGTREECYAACGMSSLRKMLRSRSLAPEPVQQYGEDYIEDQPTIENNDQDYQNNGNGSGQQYPNIWISRSLAPETVLQHGEDYIEDEPTIENNAQDNLNNGNQRGQQCEAPPISGMSCLAPQE